MIKRYQIGEIVYLVYFVLLLGTRALGMYEGNAVYAVVLLLAVSLFVLKIIVTPHNLWEYLMMVILMGIAGMVYLHTGEKGLIVCFMTILGMKGVDRIKVLKCAMITASIAILFRVVTGVSGLLPEIYYPQIRDGVGLMFRHSLGYAHPNTLHMNVFMLTTIIGYVFTSWTGGLDDAIVCPKNKRVTLIILSVVLMGFNLYIFRYSGSRTGLLATGVYLIVNLLFFVAGSENLLCRIICYGIYPLVCFISIVLPLILPDGLFEFVDRKIFTTRFSIARYFWSNNHVSMLGIRLNNPDPEYRTYGLDMAHLYLFLQLGIVAFAVISVLTFIFVRESIRHDMMAELALFTGVMCAGIWEPFLYNLGFKNMTFVFMGSVIYGLVGTLVADSEPVAGSTDRHKSKELSGRVRILFDPRFLAITLGISIGLGVLASSVYLVATVTPEYLYGDREEDEAGESFGMDEIYLTADDIDSIRSAGNLVVGYTDEKTPMYRYDTDIAVMEYGKRVMSAGVFTSLICVVPAGIIISKNRRFGELEK